MVGGKSTVVKTGLMTPPDNIGPRSTPNYHSLATEGIHSLADGSTVFAGQRDDPFFADVGAIFDLVAIRYGHRRQPAAARTSSSGYGVHSIALQIPKSQLDNNGNHTIGVWAATDRQKVTVRNGQGGGRVGAGLAPRQPADQRGAHPDEHEGLLERQSPSKDKQFEKYYSNPILATVLEKLYPQFGPFKDTGRSDLDAVLLTGMKTPALNYTGPTLADELRLNLSIPPTPFDKINRLGVIGGDLAGYPNGRRLEDDVIDISERAVGGALIGHKLPLGDGVDANDVPEPHVFPYVADPFSGFDNTKSPALPKTG